MARVERDVLRVMSYNIRACLGMDGVRSLDRIAETIRAEDPVVVALQEVDTHRERSELVDQSAELAAALGMHVLAPPALHEGRGSYGNALLSRLPMELVRHELLPIVEGTEPRSSTWVRIRVGGHLVNVLNTHLSFRRRDRPRQIAELLGQRWLGSADLRTRTILCGDLNCSARNRDYRKLHHVLADSQQEGPTKARCTWPTRRPIRRIDHIMVSRDLRIEGAWVSRSDRGRIASDHYPLIADLRIE